MAGAISYGTLVAFVTYSIQFFEPIEHVARIFAELQSAQASAERVLSMIDTPLEIEDSPEVKAKYGDVFHPRKENWEPIKVRLLSAMSALPIKAVKRCWKTLTCM